MLRTKRVIEEGLLASAVSIGVGVVAGLGLAAMRGTLQEMAGLLVMIPAFMGMRGNISGSLSNRISTALHKGSLKPVYRWSGSVSLDILGFMVLGSAASLLVGVFAYVVCLALGFPTAGFMRLTLTSLIAGVIANLVMIFLTFFSTIFFFRRGVDPDTVMGPYITSIGDVVSVISLFAAARVILGSW